MAISPAFALGEGNRNLFLIGVMGLSPILILKYFEFDKKDIWLLVFLVSIVIFPYLVHPETMRWSTVLYTMMFGFTFIAYKQLLRQKHLSITHYINVLRLLIYAYFIVLLIQQFCVLTGLTVFNVSNYDPTKPWKLNTLAGEPSHSARIVAVLMYSYITVKELITNRKYNFKFDINKDKWVWIAFIWTMFTMGSGTAFLFITIILLKFVRFKNLIPIFILAGGLIIVINYLEITAAERSYKTIIATLTLDQATILEADHSASIRILPFLILVKMVSLNSLDGWFGHGVDHVSTFLSDFIPGVNEGLSGGGFFQIWMEYGFISVFLFFIFSFFSSYRKGDFFSIFFWFMLVFLYGVNNQIVWLCLILLFTNKYFFKRTSTKNKLQNENS
ncbi:hypothetical protein OAB88_08955 [Winogradskyella sp.]|nr:hypothetical protein [Winogradskyella sp.]